MWLLFYSLPILVQSLPPDCSNHFALLATAMHILLGSRLDAAHEMLELMPQLCQRRCCLQNSTVLIHLTRCVGFENMNGHIKLHRHGCKNFLPSLVNAVPSLVNAVPSLVNAVTMKYCVSNCVKRLSKTKSP